MPCHGKEVGAPCVGVRCQFLDSHGLTWCQGEHLLPERCRCSNWVRLDMDANAGCLEGPLRCKKARKEVCRLDYTVWPVSDETFGCSSLDMIRTTAWSAGDSTTNCVATIDRPATLMGVSYLAHEREECFLRSSQTGQHCQLVRGGKDAAKDMRTWAEHLGALHRGL